MDGVLGRVEEILDSYAGEIQKALWDAVQRILERNSSFSGKQLWKKSLEALTGPVRTWMMRALIITVRTWKACSAFYDPRQSS